MGYLTASDAHLLASNLFPVRYSTSESRFSQKSPFFRPLTILQPPTLYLCSFEKFHFEKFDHLPNLIISRVTTLFHTYSSHTFISQDKSFLFLHNIFQIKSVKWSLRRGEDWEGLKAREREKKRKEIERGRSRSKVKKSRQLSPRIEK